MSAVLSIDRSASRLKLNPNPQQKYWFDAPSAFRLFASFGFAQGLAGHITARDPELTDHFWVNPLGVHFSRIKVSDLLLVNAKGQKVIGDRPLNKAAFAIHAAIHEHSPKIIAAAHTHSTYGKAWSTLGRKLDTLNHGILTAGPTVETAAWWYIALDNACHTQLLAEAAGTPQPIDDAVARHTHGQIGGPEGALHSFESCSKAWSKPNPICWIENRLIFVSSPQPGQPLPPSDLCCNTSRSVCVRTADSSSSSIRSEQTPA